MQVSFNFDSISFGVVAMAILFVLNLIFLINDKLKFKGEVTTPKKKENDLDTIDSRYK